MAGWPLTRLSAIPAGHCQHCEAGEPTTAPVRFVCLVYSRPGRYDPLPGAVCRIGSRVYAWLCDDCASEASGLPGVQSVQRMGGHTAAQVLSREGRLLE